MAVGGLAVAGCAPVKMGAAAIVGDQRVTIANLDTESGKLASAVKSYPGVVSLSQQQITQQTLSWLIRFQINEQLARQAGITVTTAQADSAFSQVYNSAKAQAEQSGVTNVTPDLILVANGIAPNLRTELGRFQAIEDEYLKRLNGGTQPTSNTPGVAGEFSKYQHAQCLAAKSLNIKVNPQFGRLDYSSYAVVAAPDTVSRPSGAAQTTSLAGMAPAC
jgi:hypothetical protein